MLELIVVIVVLGILVAIGAFSYNRFIDGQRADAVTKTATQVGKAIQGDSATTNTAYGDATYNQARVEAIALADSPSGTTLTGMSAAGQITVTRDGHTATLTFTPGDVGTGFTLDDPEDSAGGDPGGDEGGPGGTPGPGDGWSADEASLRSAMDQLRDALRDRGLAGDTSDVVEYAQFPAGTHLGFVDLTFPYMVANVTATYFESGALERFNATLTDMENKYMLLRHEFADDFVDEYDRREAAEQETAAIVAMLDDAGITNYRSEGGDLLLGQEAAETVFPYINW